MKLRIISSMALFAAALGCSIASAGADGGAAAHFQQSYDAEAAGKTGEALAALDALPNPQRQGYVAELRRAWLLYRLGKHADSIAAYGRALAIEPRSVEARVGALAPAIALKRWSVVESGAREVVKIDAANYLANLRLAFALYNLGRYSESASVYKRLSESYPSDVEVRAGLGWALLKSGKTADASTEFRAVLEVAPHNALASEGVKATGAG